MSRKWQPTPVLLPGKVCAQRSLAGYSPWVARSQRKWAAEHRQTRARLNPGWSDLRVHNHRYKDCFSKYSPLSRFWGLQLGHTFGAAIKPAAVYKEKKDQVKTRGTLFHVNSIFLGRRQWQPTPVLLPGKSHRKSFVGCSPWDR